MHDATADLVRELRVPSDAGDEAIQDALKKVVQSSPSSVQSNSVQFSQFSSTVRVSVQRSRHQAQIKFKPQAQFSFRDQTSIQQPVLEFSSSKTTQCTVTIAQSSITIDQDNEGENLFFINERDSLFRYY